MMPSFVASLYYGPGPSHRSLSHDFHYLRVALEDSFCFLLPGVRAPSVSFGSHLTLLSATVGFLETTESCRAPVVVLLWRSGKTEWRRRELTTRCNLNPGMKSRGLIMTIDWTRRSISDRSLNSLNVYHFLPAFPSLSDKKTKPMRIRKNWRSKNECFE